jgi:1-acyl-sn-glycerol-3-phosphate acyltransferase
VSGRAWWADWLQRLFFLLVVRPFLTLFIGLRVRGREHLPEKGPFLLVANHSSHLDTVSLLALFPLGRLTEIRPVAAADYFDRNRVVSFLTRTFFNILPIVRKREDVTPENDPRKAMVEALKAGSSLLIFPEGTRGTEPAEIGRFKSGVAYLVENVPGLPVVAAYLENMGRSLPKGAWIPVPFFCRVSIGPARTYGGSSPEIMAGIEAAVRELMENSAP